MVVGIKEINGKSHFNNKRGVSPLLATVVLIGFAVAIGAVIMSWGKTAFEKAENESKTNQPSDDLQWYMGSNIENICYSDDGIKFTLKANPKIKIQGLFVASKGADDYIVNDGLQFPQNEGEAVDVSVPYSTQDHGEISQLILGAVDTAIITTPPPRCT